MLLIKNKKGEEAEPRTGVIAAAIAVFVLIIVIFGIVTYWPEISSWVRYMPGFNQSESVNVGKIRFLKYNIPEQKVYYYDATEWILFENKVIDIDGKKIDYNKIKLSFSRFYFGGRSDIVEKDGLKLKMWFDIDGDVEIECLFGCQGKNKYVLLSRMGNLMDVLTMDVEESIDLSDLEKQGISGKILQIAVEWRDAPLRKPIELVYGDGTKEKFCVSKYMGVDLVIDLSNPTKEDKCDLKTS